MKPLMDARRLDQWSRRFASEFSRSEDLKALTADGERRKERASALLTAAQIPLLEEPQIRELFFDTRAFRYWQDKEGELRRRIAKVGLDGLRSSLQFLVGRAEDGLTPEDLRELLANTGLGLLLSTELATYRFPLRCWIYSPRVTLAALKRLGLDLRKQMPYGQKSDPFVYAALREPMASVQRALEAAGLKDVDYVRADQFVWWINQQPQVPDWEKPLAQPRRASRAKSVREPEADYECRPVEVAGLLRGSLLSRGLRFTPWQIAAFYTALQVKGFVILSGISGTGKTRLAQHFAALLDPDSAAAEPREPAIPAAPGRKTRAHSPAPPAAPAAKPPGNSLFLPVRPDWTDSKSLLGYYNPLTNTYSWTGFLHFLIQAALSYGLGDGRAWFVILDEMNLARVEYYFADLLSVLESGRDENGLTVEPLRFSLPSQAEGELPPAELYLPPNLYVVGTVNTDETTHPFSPRVLDRAFTLQLTDVDFRPPSEAPTFQALSRRMREAMLREFTWNGQFPRPGPGHAAPAAASLQIPSRLQNLNDLLRPHHLHFGYRVFDEIISFLEHASRSHVFGPVGGMDAAFDAAVLMKILPRFHGSRGRLDRPLRSLLAWCLNPDQPDHLAIQEALRAVETAGAADAATVIERELGRIHYACPTTAAHARALLRILYAEGFAAFV